MRRRLVLCLLLAFCAAASAAQDPIGEVLWPKEVSRTRPEVKGGSADQDEASYRGLQKEDPILDRMRVVTRKRATAEILLHALEDKPSTVRMGGNTALTFYRGLAEGKLNLELAWGRCLALIWPDSPNAEGVVTIDTPAGLIVLLGTTVFVDVARDGSTFLLVQEGSVEVEPKAGGDAVTVSTGEWTYIAMGEQPTPPMSFDTSREGGMGLIRRLSDIVLLEPPLIDLDDPRLNLPK